MAVQTTMSGINVGATGIVDQFIPPSLLHARSSRGLARVFVASHLVGAAASFALLSYLIRVVGSPDLGIGFVAVLSVVLAALPVLLRFTGNLALVSLVSFQILAITSLVGTFQYGGFASPFLPWILVSLMSGLFYQSRRTGLVIALFLFDTAIFFAFLIWRGRPDVHGVDFTGLGWVSIAVAMTYMAYMALYYARVSASRAELQLEAERSRAVSSELEQARAAAESLSRSRSQFFSKMSHELRTPLNAVIGYSEILLEEFEGKETGNQRRMADLRSINSTGRHLLSLVADVLDVDTVEKGETSLELSTLTLGELCDSVVATAQPLVEARGNTLVVDCAIRGDLVTTDATKLRQMLLNLLSNAAKFTERGTITLELWVERSEADDRLHAAVFDTGIGIPANVLPQLFETYVQADRTIQGRFGGTGIGLALTRKFAALLGGTVAVESQLGKGSVFTIDIPATTKNAVGPVAGGGIPFAQAGSR